MATTQEVGSALNPKSWAESIKALEYSKKNAYTYVPLERLNVMDRKLKEKELNPVLMQYDNASQEQTMRNVESQQSLNKSKSLSSNRDFNIISNWGVSERGLDAFDQAGSRPIRGERGPVRNVINLDNITSADVDEDFHHGPMALVPTRKLNIINHEGIPDEEVVQTRPKEIRAKRDWNLVSNLDNKSHTYFPFAYDQNLHMTLSNSNRVAPKEKNLVQKRDFNITSNKYLKDHDARARTDNEKMRADLTKLYWETHQYDPIKLEYYDEKTELTNSLKEKEYFQMIRNESENHLPERYSVVIYYVYIDVF